MKVRYFEWNRFPKELYNQLVNRLYDGLKPSIQVNSYVDGVIGVFEHDEALGMVTVYDNPDLSEHLILGQFESVEDPTVMRKLLDEADDLRLRRGKENLLGPMNGSTWHSYRFRIKEARPYFMESVHKDYYRKAWLDFGFQHFHTYQTNVEALKTELDLPETLSFYEEKGLTKRKMNVMEPENDLRLIHSFCLELFRNNVLFSSISYDEFRDLYAPVLSYLNSDLIDLVFDGGKLVGLFFAVPDLLDKKRVLVKTIARAPNPKYRGLAHMMSADFYKNALAMGFQEMLNVYFHLDNASSRVSKNYGGKMHQQYELLIKQSK